MNWGIGIIIRDDADGEGFWILIGIIFVIALHYRRIR